MSINCSRHPQSPVIVNSKHANHCNVCLANVEGSSSPVRCLEHPYSSILRMADTLEDPRLWCATCLSDKGWRNGLILTHFEPLGVNACTQQDLDGVKASAEQILESAALARAFEKLAEESIAYGVDNVEILPWKRGDKVLYARIMKPRRAKADLVAVTLGS